MVNHRLELDWQDIVGIGETIAQLVYLLNQYKLDVCAKITNQMQIMHNVFPFSREMYVMVNYNFKKKKLIMHMIIIETNGSYPQLIMEEIKLHGYI